MSMMLSRGGARALRALVQVAVGLPYEWRRGAKRAVDQPARPHDGVSDAAPPQKLLACRGRGRG